MFNWLRDIFSPKKGLSAAQLERLLKTAGLSLPDLLKQADGEVKTLAQEGSTKLKTADTDRNGAERDYSATIQAATQKRDKAVNAADQLSDAGQQQLDEAHELAMIIKSVTA